MSTSRTVTAVISPPVFFGIAWMFAGVCFALLAFRIYVRISSYRRLYADDAFAIAAWLFFVANNILWHMRLDSVYVLTGFEAGTSFPGLDQINQILDFLKSLVAFNLLFLCSLWSVKLSFILFFRRLGERLTQKYIKVWWWVVTATTISAFAVCIGTFDYGCSVADLPSLLANCLNQDARDRQARDTRINTAMDIITDGLIITIPVVILWDSRLPSNKKLGLIGIFGLSILTMIFALIRLLVIPAGTISSDLTWSFLWSNIEMGVAIMVACLGAFRQLYVNKKDQDRKGYVHSDGAQGSRRLGWGLLANVRSIFTRSNGSSRGLLGSWISGRSSQKQSQAPTEMSLQNGNSRNPQNTMITSDDDRGPKAPTGTYIGRGRDDWTMDRSKFVDVTTNDSWIDPREEDLESYAQPFYHAHGEDTPLHRNNGSNNNIRVEHSFVVESDIIPHDGREYASSALRTNGKPLK